MSESSSHQPEIPRGPRSRGYGTFFSRPLRTAGLIVLVGLVLTAATWATTLSVNRHTERRLLDVQTRQAAAVIAGEVQTIESPLATAASIESATGDNPSAFSGYMSSFIGPGRLFVAASLWRTGPPAPASVATIGAGSELAGTAGLADFIDRASHSKGLVVTGIPAARPNRIGFALTVPSNRGTVVYAERAIPADREVSIESSSAFADLRYATYLGSSTGNAELATTDVPVSDLPLSGTTDRIAVPFGDTSVTLVAAAAGPLSGTLVAALPWIFVAVGAALSFAAGGVAWQLVKRRRAAERDATTITELYDRLDDRYVEQRSIAETLQRALLPLTNPTIANLDIATRYVAGADGVDVGGDWYSAIVLEDDRHFAFVVGDVSGRGVEAATIMARLRFTLRAYLLEGHPPDTALEMCAKHIKIGIDRHFATVLVGRGDLSTRTIELANAGHLKPLVIDDSRAYYVETPVGRPLGLGPCTYTTTTITMNPGATLVAFTDGLVERRGEDLLVSMERLAETALGAEPQAAAGRGLDVESLLTRLVTTMTPEGPTDDIAILALRWYRTSELQPIAQGETVDDSASSTLIPDAIS